MGEGVIGNEYGALSANAESDDGAIFGVECFHNCFEFGEGFSEP